LLRGGNADLNMTTACRHILRDVVCLAIQATASEDSERICLAQKVRRPELLKILMIVLFFAVGWLEVISILFRPIALSFRLFGKSMLAKAFSKRCPR